MGFLPQAVVNFLALLGWSPGDDIEVLSTDTLIRRFSLERVTKKSAVFDIQKLEWLNGRYLSECSSDDLFEDVTAQWVDSGLLESDEIDARRTWLTQLIDLLKSRARVFSDFTDLALPYLREDFPYDEKAVRKRWKQPDEVIRVLTTVSEEIHDIESFEPALIEEKVRGVAERLGVSNSRVFHPVRVALTGRLAGPGLFELMVVLGKEVCLERFSRARQFLKS
jgi:glutamyl-tRNA synthetase